MQNSLESYVKRDNDNRAHGLILQCAKENTLTVVDIYTIQLNDSDERDKYLATTTNNAKRKG